MSARRLPERPDLDQLRRQAKELRDAARTGDATEIDIFLEACLRADRVEVERLVRDRPGLLDRPTEPDRATVVQAADHGKTEAVRLMLDLGFPLHARGDDGATPLHAAAASGSVAVVRLLLERGADIEARDTAWDSTPVEWATVGSGMRLGHDPDPDFVATVQALIDAGASTEGAWIDDKPPSPDVAELLRTYGISGTSDRGR